MKKGKPALAVTGNTLCCTWVGTISQSEERNLCPAELHQPYSPATAKSENTTCKQERKVYAKGVSAVFQVGSKHDHLKL